MIVSSPSCLTRQSDRTFVTISAPMNVSFNFSAFVMLIDTDLKNMVKRIQPDWKDPFILRRHLIRANIPFAKGTATGVHYDQLFLRAGPATALTAWVPIGDCGPMNGGLMYLEDSVKVGQRIEDRFTEMCREKGMSEEERLYAFNQNVSWADE